MSHCLRPLLERIPSRRHSSTSEPALVAERSKSRSTRARGAEGCWVVTTLPQGSALVPAPCNAVHTCRMRFPIDVMFVTRDGRGHEDRATAGGVARGRIVQAFATIELRGGAIDGADLTIGDHLVVVSRGAQSSLRP